ncbi:hypothetical protein SAMD00019534_012030, partial [Acytostelium subglobosum LB1]|uniref:hypothetical protein n=1 Tax=Acytostelium subglobosum LB1 TaxID=1410327 RepID=UPI000644BA41
MMMNNRSSTTSIQQLMLLLVVVVATIMVVVVPTMAQIPNYPTITVDKQVFTQSTVIVSVLLNHLTNDLTLQLTSEPVPPQSSVVASGAFSDDIATTGWSRLNITTHPTVSDIDQAFIGGFIEGVVSAQRISQMWTNYASNEFTNSTPSSTLISYMSSQLQWVRQSIAAPHTASPTQGSINGTVYWYSVGLVMAQFDGLVAGYAAVPALPVLNEMDLYLLTSAGDLETLNELYGTAPTGRARKHMMTGDRDDADAIDFLDCSALIRVLPNNQDIYFGHTTWRYFYAMMRVYKTYTFAFKNYGLASSVSFSSSPGFLSSKDDFYITGNGLAVAETTNSIFNDTLYTYVIPETLLVWQRAIVSNMISQSPQVWVQLFQQFNSGTYNNQWMVLDYKMFTPGTALPAGSFFILEQIPGFCEVADMTANLNKNGFWPSYNIPYSEYVYNISGYNEMFEKYGNSYSYENCPRAQIFNRNATSITDFAEMQSIMQFNNYQKDPLSLGSPMNSISSRADLLSSSPVGFGGVDSKITSFKLAQTLSCSAISGPTHQGQPPFRFSANPSFNNASHVGLPDVWDFGWVDF